MANTEEGVLYVGPYRVEIKVKFLNGILCITGKDQRLNPMGYPNVARGRAFISYDISHLSPMLQSAYRNEDNMNKWTAYMCVMGEIWKGSMEYQWADNSLLCHLRRID